METVKTLIADLRTGEMDFHGQRLAGDIQFYGIWVFGLVGFVVGLALQRFLYTFYVMAGGTALVTVVCMFSWPCFRRNKLKWLPKLPRPEEEEDSDSDDSDSEAEGEGDKKKKEKTQEKGGGKKGASAGSKPSKPKKK
uniref:Signal peptidase complex subunit 1 n=1 Tax=Chromera velia CCMP2878 TaxID=1169474 RepID=A0A0G4HPP8_9ALVE|mmetsp:Transcript_44272/g.87374  ORF Transcript_44272/g.87374 Transcript_44272/m.87374 type:complete len:138 (-) Transcript_44272:276-689(-)|eukprot:Cvel_29960.t1-p1 / transcript=Cvel_29960.t1 / gene=Cvel_29960 / organism=Chromera_velia_CCMP2878 / gene_product=hypothetical protein / transcript_product=hypothetical protein / location=Cvel_scaffold4197:8088-8891(+) / protein_length=137 / sequence_SO=supercontig / SO=protein_coding / is_pseudo=false